MKGSSTTRWVRLLVSANILFLAGCASSRLHSDGMRLVALGNYEAALPMLHEASSLEPDNSEFRIDFLKKTDVYSRELVQRGNDARHNDRPAEATDLYTRAIKVDPANEQAQRGLAFLDVDARSARLVADSENMLKEGRLEAARDKVNSALAENPGNRAAQRQLSVIADLTDKAHEAQAARAASQSIMRKPVTLQFRDANLRMVFEALSRTNGLNVILDRDVRADLKTTIFVKDAAVEDTVDLILLQNQLEKRALNANTFFIFPATPAKQKEYQDLQVRTFQIANADAKYLQTVLKTVLKIKDVSVDERTNTLVIRDTADAIAVAEKVIAAHDVPDPEVMLEVEVLEVSHDRLTNLGIKFPDAITLSTPTDISGTLTLGGLKALTRDDLLVTPLTLGINLKLQDTDANILASPRIRARNKEKARILIGDRVPTITNTVTPVQSGSGVVTGSVQYQDVGLKLEFEPQVYSDQEVGIRISLEVSSIVREIAGPNGSLAYQIGTRNAQTAVRLRDGETQVLGGLISSEDRNTAAKLPGLGHLPVIGRIFGNNTGTNGRTEIVLSITPHILRGPAMIDASLRNVYSGTEGSLRERALQLDPIGLVRGQSTGSPAPTTVPTRPLPVMPPTERVPEPGAANDAPPNQPQLRVVPNIRNLLPLMNSARSGAGVLPAVAPAPSASAPAAGNEGKPSP